MSAIDSKIWIGQNGQKYGPYSGASVRQWFAEGKLAASTMAWRSGMSEWVTLATMIHAMAIDEPLPRPSLPPQDEAPPPPFLMTAALPPAAVAQVHSVTEEAQPPQRPQNAPSPLPVAPIAQTPSSPTAPWVHSTTTPLVDLSPKDYARKHMPSAKRSHSGRWAVGLVLVLIASGALAWTYLPHENLVTNLIQGYGFVSDPSGSSQTASDSSSRNAGLEVGRNGFMQPIGGMTLLQKSSVTFRLGTGAKKSSSGFHSDGIVLIRDGKMGVCFRSDSKQPYLCDYGKIGSGGDKAFGIRVPIDQSVSMIFGVVYFVKPYRVNGLEFAANTLILEASPVYGNDVDTALMTSWELKYVPEADAQSLILADKRDYIKLSESNNAPNSMSPSETQNCMAKANLIVRSLVPLADIYGQDWVATKAREKMEAELSPQCMATWAASN